MNTQELKAELDRMGNELVPVAGLLMQVATSNGRVAREPDEHDEGCECRVCLAFLKVQDIQNQLERLVEELSRG